MVGSALTRIRNNQVYNSDIDAATKIVPYSITGGLWANSLTYAGNLVIGGNLTVNGTTETLDATNLVIADPLLVLNRNQSGAPSYDVGLVMARGNQTNTAFVWEEGNKQFQLQYTTETSAGSTLGAINNSGYANLQAYGIKVNNSTVGTSTVTNLVSGNVSITGGTLDNITIGATTPNTIVATSVTTSSGGQHIGYHTGAIGANSANTGNFTTLTTGTAQVNGTLTAVTVNAGTIGNTGAALTASTATLTGTANSYGSGQGALQITGGFYAGGDSYIRGNLTVANITSIGYNQLIVNAPLVYLQADESNYNYEIGFYSQKLDNVVGYNHTGLTRNHLDNAWYLFSNIKTEPTNTVDLGNASIIYDTLKLGNLIALSGNSSTTTSTGAVVVSGGAGISGTLNVGGNIFAASNISSTGTTTGALVVNGGAGVSGNIYGGANIVATSSVVAPNMYNNNVYPLTGSDLNKYLGVNGNLNVNPSGLTANLIVQGNWTNGYQNLLVTNGATGQVGIKVAPGVITTGASLQVNSTDSMIIPAGTTGQRPTGAAGMIRYNNQSNQLEFYNSGTSAWSGTGSSFTTITADSFTGNGSQTAFTLSQSTTTNGTIVAINGVIQIPLTAYSVVGTTLTFTEAPLSTDIIDARSIVTTASVTSISQNNSYVQVSDTGGTTANVAIVSNNLIRHIANINGNYFGGGISPVAGNTSCAANTPTIIDSFDNTVFRGAKYVVSMQDYTNYNFQMAEVILVTGNSNATVQTYGVVSANGVSFCNFYANVSGSTARLYANSSVASFAKVQQIYMPI
jgi:hypothetical protein